MYYKILHNNQIIDVLENIRYVKCLPRTQKVIEVEKSQANGIVSSNGDTIYHLFNTKNTFKEEKLSVVVEEITEEEFLKLTTQLINRNDLQLRIQNLENLVQNLQELLLKS